MKLGNISTVFIGEDENVAERAGRRLKTLVSSVEGTYPMHRSIGIDAGVTDMPAKDAMTAISTAIYTAVEEHLPSVDVEDIACTCEDDILNVKISFSLAEDEEDDMNIEMDEEEDYERV